MVKSLKNKFFYQDQIIREGEHVEDNCHHQTIIFALVDGTCAPGCCLPNNKLRPAIVSLYSGIASSKSSNSHSSKARVAIEVSVSSCNDHITSRCMARTSYKRGFAFSK